MRTFILNPDATKATCNFSNGGGLINIRLTLGRSIHHFPLSITIQTSLVSVSLVSPQNIVQI